MKSHQLLRLFTYSDESGFTIIESLVALLVAAILLTAIAPVLVMSTATRLQSRRVELATQAAKTYIDGVQARTIDPPAETNTTPSGVPTAGSLTCDANKYCIVPATPANNLFCIDGNTDGKCTSDNSRDFVIQAFRYNKATTDATAGYQLEIRVYRADGFRDSSALGKNAPNKVTQKTVAEGLGDRKAPLLEITTDVVTGQPSYNNLCLRIGGCS
ncbi:type II secretion system protein [Nostoc sp. FACHB-87]|uniref:hormogonium polysaccharide secretion pseudopilin HpsB n=1 Tax=Nostocales TaxID=1161 RepID=UPI001688E0A8|nr:MULTISPECIES: hormogonium polysaccharide secretion pseudopilin HpsB [Nostocales]MBD2453361.1 type II secretion system protein [Nostoc sp. FACHB-87]MBD2475485.1 type II secretion system protein [Anabaena sp. FACHB-83]MBD2490257.1 type II secretion system protein [Aulosira sp. FACHB-615]